MPIFTDTDKLNFIMRRDIISSIKKKSLEAIAEASNKVGGVLEEAEATDSEVRVIREDKAVKMEVTTNVPIENAAEVANKIDGAIKGTFRFGKWSDMKVS